MAERKNIQASTAECYLADVMGSGAVTVTQDMMTRVGVTDEIRSAVKNAITTFDGTYALRELKERCPEVVSYAHIKYVLAEINQSNPEK